MTACERRAGGERFAPRPLLARLREVDPAAELMYVGDGVWWLGTYHPNQRNRAAGVMKMRAALTVPVERQKDPESRRMFRVGELQQSGFVFLSEYEVQGDPDATLADDLVRMDWMFRREAYSDHAFHDSMHRDRKEQLERSREVLRDRDVAKEAWMDWRRARGARVTVGGFHQRMT